MEVLERSKVLFEDQKDRLYRRTDRMFAVLMGFQWVCGIIFALVVSPRTWVGSLSQTHIHVWAAVLLGGAISSLPILLALKAPGRPVTRHVIAVGQMLTSALLIHLTGGRIETHFHVFGSLAFLAIYRDWSVILTATVIVALDHFFRGLYWPQSVFGVLMVQPWRFLEHAAWVIFEDIFLIYSIKQGVQESREIAAHRAHLEVTNKSIEQQVIERTTELEKSRSQLIQAEKLSAVGQLASGVAHEINNPLGVILGFAQTLKSQIAGDHPMEMPLSFIERETLRCKDLVQKLLVFSRTSKTEQREEIDLNGTIEEALTLIMTQGNMKDIHLVKKLDRDLPKLRANKNQIQQILINLCNNAMDAMSKNGTLSIVTNLKGAAGEERLMLQVSDTGSGISKDIQSKIFEPFFTTKEIGKGTGLGLSLVYELVQRHKGTIDVRSEVGKGATFTIFFSDLGEPVKKGA